MFDDNELRKLVPTLSKLTAFENGFNVTETRQYDNKTFFVSDDDLARIDERLPFALRFMENTGHNVTGICVFHTLKLWDADMHFLSSGLNNVAFNRVSRVTFFDTSISIKGEGFCYDIVPYSNNSEHIYIYKTMAPVITSIDKEWLDKKMPSWLERYTLCHDLGLSLTESVKAMQTAPGNENSLPIPGDLLL